MKQFFKFMFASCLGSALMLVIIFFVLIGSISSSIGGSKSTATVKPQSVLYMNLNYDIPDRSVEDQLTLALSGLTGSLEQSDMSGMNDILTNIEAAATDPNIAGIFLELSSVGTSSANIEEIRERLIAFRESGKFVISYSENMAQDAYYLATASDEIYLNPMGMLDVHGMTSQVTFYKNLLDKLDIEMQIVRGPNNKFKSAVEPYFLDKMSDANREQNEKLLGSIWFQIVSDISATRGISIDKINELADKMSLTFDAEVALNEGFVDGLLYRDEIIARIKERGGISGDIDILQNAQYAEARPAVKSQTDKIAVIYASGQIYDGEGDNDKIGSVTLSKAIREARNDKKIKAIVMRVNSPGGSALASEVIRREIELAKAEKPFIISMGNYAASGGYWISAEGDRIFADATTITGSIGVFATFPNAQKFINDRVGLTFDGVKTNENADFGRIYQPLTPYQISILQKYVGNTYNDFTSLVARTRNLRQSYVDSIGQGRVWAGTDALQLGLIDEIGGIDKAIDYAAQQANLTEYSIREFPKQKDFVQTLINGNIQEPYAKSLIQNKLGKNYTYIKALESIKDIEGIQALMPFTVVE